MTGQPAYTDADVELATRTWWENSGHDWDEHIEGEDKPHLLSEFRAVLDAVAPAIAARAWDEGHRTRQVREMDDCQCGAYYEGECGCGEYGTGRIVTPNPYRADEIEAGR